MRFKNIIKIKNFLIILIIFIIFLNGCSKKDNFGYYCSDNVNLIVKPPSSYMPKLCYDEKGMINMLIMNHGNTLIKDINIYFFAENENRNITIPLNLGINDVDLLSINIPLKTMGTINRLEITPNIIFNNETLECEYYRIKVRQINECY
jgi:hypothetical protein